MPPAPAQPVLRPPLQPMSRALRICIYAVFGTLWVSGCYWLMLHYYFAQATDFGTLPHPWAAPILRLHGWFAVAGVFLLGWITARHVSDRWSQMIKRLSGLSMAGAAVALAFSGYALYYTTSRLHDMAAVIHEALGASAIMFALTHWRRYRPGPSARRRATREAAT
jgi:hypothetical protein